MDKGEVISKVKQYKLLLGKHFNLDSVYLFGSYAKDKNTIDSDIDVAVVMNNITGDFFTRVEILKYGKVENIICQHYWGKYNSLNFLIEIKCFFSFF